MTGLNRAANPGRHAHAVRGLDLYETPAVAVEALLRVEKLDHWQWEPAAARGAIATVLRDHGYAVIASDLIQYDDFRLHFIGDFFAAKKAPARCNSIVTNPPFQHADRFARHALDLVPSVYLLLRLAFLESARRSDVLEHRGLRAVHVFRKRLPRMHRDGRQGPRASSSIAFAWFCWTRGYQGPAAIDRI
jgi:hypothetical protein